MLEVDPEAGWWPQPHQDELWSYLDKGGKRAAWVVHRRGGKDEVALRWACRAAHRRRGNYWHMLPQAEQARKAIWDAVNPHTGRRRIDEAFPLELRSSTLENSMMIKFKCGSTWQVIGSDNYNQLVGGSPAGITWSEWSLADPQSLVYLEPILEENGGWALFIYTPRGRNHGLTLLNAARAQPETWFAQVLPADVTGIFSPEQLARIKKGLVARFGEEQGEARFEQEYLCSFDAAVIGAVYARQVARAEREGRIIDLPYDPELPLMTAWDLGFGDATAIWWYQVAGKREPHFIDFYQGSGKDAPTLARIVTGAEPGHEHRRGWMYRHTFDGGAPHHLPHDAGHKLQGAGGRSMGDLLHAEGLAVRTWPPALMAHSIEAARFTLERSYFDKTRCEEGLAALRSYHFPWDDKLLRLKDEPLHDWSSHPADAFEIAAGAWREKPDQPHKEKPKFLDEQTADEVFDLDNQAPKRKGGGRI